MIKFTVGTLSEIDVYICSIILDLLVMDEYSVYRILFWKNNPMK